MNPIHPRAGPVAAPILVAEDDFDDREFLLEAFQRSGLRVDVRFVDDGAALLDYLHRRGEYALAAASPRPALVLLDLNMPRMDGRSALGRLRADPALRRLPVMVLSTSSDEVDIDRCYELGANAFLCKPGRPEALAELARDIARWWFAVVELPSSLD